MKYYLCLVQILIAVTVFAQHDVKNEQYDPHQLFTGNFNPPAGNEFRSAKGVPGPKYWQNSASYIIHATLNEKDTSVQGDVAITYTNNSPDGLDYIWLELEQNIQMMILVC
jgi:hypothetical protein